jgi:hypothetical protein
LQSRGQIGCIADNRLLLRGALPDQITNDDEAGRDAHARGKLFVRTGLQAGHDLSDFQPSMHRARRVILMRAGKTEIGQDAVAHEFRDKTVVARHHARHRVLIGADDLAHVLRIEPRGKRGRADEVREHDGELATLRCVDGRGGWVASNGGWRRRNDAASERGRGL